ncbi:MAG: coenzyme F420-0:L-glutamate ligase / coenzyme F420:gamma-L-glutamate ligase [Alphaproteobacteria bacterium]|nr:coenzyme F420-0:L-glutamate ligase / coenzyme F420:gamma-L-glutamate ligase [Alphaproteobacteria bacterium]
MPSAAEKPSARPAAELRIAALSGIPLVRPGDDIADLIASGLAASGLALRRGDIVVIAQKIVSKAEGRIVDLREVTPSKRARELAAEADKDPRLVELILRESTEVVRHRKSVLVVAHRSGIVLANAGIDTSNVAGDDHRVLLLPEDCNRSCRDIRAGLAALTGVEAGVLIIDSLGRAWRNGTVGVALGAAGLPALLDLRGKPDLFGRELRSTEVGIADEIAAAASMLMGQAGEGTPVVLLRGLTLPDAGGSAADLIRARELDLFR